VTTELKTIKMVPGFPDVLYFETPGEREVFMCNVSDVPGITTEALEVVEDGETLSYPLVLHIDEDEVPSEVAPTIQTPF